jgi:hypothetical protein
MYVRTGTGYQMTFRGETCARLRTSDTAYKTDSGADFNPPAFSPSLREGVSGGGTLSGSPYKGEGPPLTPPIRGRTAPPLSGGGREGVRSVFFPIPPGRTGGKERNVYPAGAPGNNDGSPRISLDSGRGCCGTQG